MIFNILAQAMSLEQPALIIVDAAAVVQIR